MNTQEAVAQGLAITRNAALDHALNMAAQYLAEAQMHKARADALQLEVDALKKKQGEPNANTDTNVRPIRRRVRKPAAEGDGGNVQSG